MNEERELLGQMWLRLSELNDLLSVCEKGMEEAKTLEGSRACSVIRTIRQLVNQEVSLLDDYLKLH